MAKTRPFEIRHFERTGNYVVKDNKAHMYLQINELTGGVSKVNDLRKATVLTSMKQCEELITWYVEPTIPKITKIDWAII